MAIEIEILSNILKDCYWDYNIDEDDILRMLDSDDLRILQKLFSKIIYNSKNKLEALSIFPKEKLLYLFNDFKVTYNKNYIKKHLAVLRNILLNENNVVETLIWKKH